MQKAQVLFMTGLSHKKNKFNLKRYQKITKLSSQ